MDSGSSTFDLLSIFHFSLSTSEGHTQSEVRPRCSGLRSRDVQIEEDRTGAEEDPATDAALESLIGQPRA